MKMERRGRGARTWIGLPPGQVVVEVLLILPIFLLIVFSIMEIGHLAFRTILLHHAAYEVARIGSLTAIKDPGGGCAMPQVGMAQGKMKETLNRMLRNAQIVQAEPAQTLLDPQDKCANYDLIVTLREDVPLVFPMTPWVLGYPQRGKPSRRVDAAVRMPIERPLFR